MQLGDPTRVHCKINFQNTIAEVNSAQFLVLDKFFRGQRTYFMCIYYAPRCATIVVVFTWIANLILIMFSINEWQFLQLYLYQVTDYWRAYDTEPTVVEIHTNNKWYLCHRHERVNHSKEFKNGEHSMMKTWICLFCRYRIMNDSNTNILYVKS